jgi:hypothetical protein
MLLQTTFQIICAANVELIVKFTEQYVYIMEMHVPILRLLFALYQSLRSGTGHSPVNRCRFSCGKP